MAPTDRMVTVGELQREVRGRLIEAGFETAALDARLIIQHALALSHETLIAEPGLPVEKAGRDAVHASIARRLDRVVPITPNVDQSLFPRGKTVENQRLSRKDYSIAISNRLD